LPTRRILEVCIASVEDAIRAEQGGADRLELNAALELGGLTPSLGLFLEVQQAVSLPVIVMIRPRAAGFRYSTREQSLMRRDADLFLSHGAVGVAAGALLADATLDLEFWTRFVQAAADREVVFHRAFDGLPSLETGLQQLIAFGTKRILTSGGRETAVAGAARIATLQRLAAQRIEILPASGIVAGQIGPLLHATGCEQVHGSFRRWHRDPAACLGQDSYPATCQELVAAARRALDQA